MVTPTEAYANSHASTSAQLHTAPGKYSTAQVIGNPGPQPRSCMSRDDVADIIGDHAGHEISFFLLARHVNLPDGQMFGSLVNLNESNSYKV